MMPHKSGPEHHSWKGGIADYPNHSEMKRNRLIKLRETDRKCEVCGDEACGDEAFCIHHLDGSKDNHELENLAVICKKCHTILHAGDGRQTSNTKYIRLYGMTLREMAERFGGSLPFYANMHKRGELQEYLDRHEKDSE